MPHPVGCPLPHERHDRSGGPGERGVRLRPSVSVKRNSMSLSSIGNSEITLDRRYLPCYGVRSVDIRSDIWNQHAE